MSQPEIKIYQNKIKAAHIYEVVESNGSSSIAGKKFHFIGAGGIGMSGLAQMIIKNKGKVTGSDQTQTRITDQLCIDGADIKIGHTADNLPNDTNAVVISAAITQNNPELIAARQKGCKIYKYAQALGLLMSRYEGIAIAGTHGKSTTTGWLVFLLKQAGLDPGFIVGADISQLKCSSGVGNGQHFIAEACEYDRSFLNLKPKIACILNIEADHLDYYKDEAEIVETFKAFAASIKPNGTIIANTEDTNTAKIIANLPANLNCKTFGLSEESDFYADNIQLVDGCYHFDVYHKAALLGIARIQLPGKHNILNTLAVIAIAISAGMEPETIFQILPKFTGIDRRMMLKDKIGQITVLDDYAHHPTEIKASLSAIREKYQPKRIFCVFQPHQYSRTRFLLDDFAESFKLADIAVVPQIYFVRDTQSAKKEINSQILVDKICSNGSEAVFIDGFDEICDYLKENVGQGDLVVTMGAGDIWKVADGYIQWLRQNS